MHLAVYLYIQDENNLRCAYNCTLVLVNELHNSQPKQKCVPGSGLGSILQL